MSAAFGFFWTGILAAVPCMILGILATKQTKPDSDVFYRLAGTSLLFGILAGLFFLIAIWTAVLL